MKFLTRFYYLPFLIGIIISILFWVGSFEVKLRAEGLAKIDTSHKLADNISKIYWENSIKKILNEFNDENFILYLKRDHLRFYSSKNDLDEIKKNYLIIKDEFKKYKKIHLEYINFKIQNELENKELKIIKFQEKILKDRQNYVDHFIRINYDYKEEKFIENFKKKQNFYKKLFSIISENKFLQDLQTNEIIIYDYQFIYITLLISFLLSVILYNLKKIF